MKKSKHKMTVREKKEARSGYLFICPWVFQLMTPDLQVRQLAAEVLRIQLFAEPLYGVSIVASGALRGKRL